MIRSRTARDPITVVVAFSIVLGILLTWEIFADSSITIRLLLSSPLRTCVHPYHHFSEAGQAFFYTGLESVLGLTWQTYLPFSSASCAFITRVSAASVSRCW